MPRKPVNYNNGVIYKIVCNDLNIKECYYGSTTSFVKRKNRHKSDCHNPKRKIYNQPIYKFIRENGGWNNWKMILIKKFPCSSKYELEKEERNIMEQDHKRLNVVLPTRTRTEYNKDNKEKITVYNSEYRQKNIDRLLEKGKNFYNENKERLNTKKKQYYHENKTTILKQKREKITCKCGVIMNKSSLYEHLKTKKHKQLLEQLEQI
jgi:hypothetical protein